MFEPTLVTFGVRITCPFIWTSTNWSVSHGLTLSILTAGVILDAWIQTLVIYASSIVRAVDVMLTFPFLD